MVSIIMGVYNGASTLAEALDSIIRQTYKDWELIVCDDCSTDGSLEILEQYEKKDARIKVIKNVNNRGLAASLNHCLEYVRGKYIARMDCDDMSVETRLQVQVSFLEDNQEYDLVGTYMQAFAGGITGEIIKTKLNPTKYDLPKGAPFAHATILMRTDVMKKLKGYCVSRYTQRTEDVDLWYRFFAEGFNGTNIPDPLYLVRIDEDAYKRRKLKYMLHAAYIMWYGCDLVKLPFYYKGYCIKPILSWIFPKKIKAAFRKYIIK